jgi:hypothetical protein
VIRSSRHGGRDATYSFVFHFLWNFGPAIQNP